MIIWKIKRFFRLVRESINKIKFEMKTSETPGIMAMTTITQFDNPDMYIGTIDWGLILIKKGIDLETLESPNGSVACIGFNPKQNKWYGWSHRAMYGFTIGSTCKKGNCHYSPSNKTEWEEDIIEWYDNSEVTFDDQGAIIKSKDWISREDYPESYGKGEWTALTMEDAKQMAIDFADGVS